MRSGHARAGARSANVEEMPADGVLRFPAPAGRRPPPATGRVGRVPAALSGASGLYLLEAALPKSAERWRARFLPP